MVFVKFIKKKDLLSLVKLCFVVFFFNIFFLKMAQCLTIKNEISVNQHLIIPVFSTESIDENDSTFKYDMLSSIEDFVSLPEGGTPWNIFADTEMDEYTFEDSDGFEWTGVRPKFSEDLKILEDKEILVQGYMFPLDQNEEQKTFLLIPFPVHCPYYPHASSNLIIEVHAKEPITFSYETIDIKGNLELVPKDDLYNIFFRLNNAKVILD